MLIRKKPKVAPDTKGSTDGTPYFRDGRLIYDIQDDEPYLEGWFGFRTVRNQMRIHHFEVSLEPYKKAEKLFCRNCTLGPGRF